MLRRQHQGLRETENDTFGTDECRKPRSVRTLANEDAKIEAVGREPWRDSRYPQLGNLEVLRIDEMQSYNQSRKSLAFSDACHVLTQYMVRSSSKVS